MDQTPQKILLLEDEEAIRELYKMQFTKAGFQVDAVQNGKSALDAIAKNKYDILLFDIMLPDMNGLEVLKKVKSIDESKNIPVLLMTNLGQDAVIKEGFQLGADGYILKSAYTPDQIIQEIKNTLQRKQATTTPTV